MQVLIPKLLNSLWQFVLTLINFCHYFQFVSVWIHIYAYLFSLFSTFQRFHNYWLFFYKQCTLVGPMHCLRDPQTSLFSAIFSLKISLMALFTQLNIILLQCFQFSIFCKINCIQTNPLYLYFLLFYRPLFLSYLT